MGKFTVSCGSPSADRIYRTDNLLVRHSSALTNAFSISDPACDKCLFILSFKIVRKKLV